MSTLQLEHPDWCDRSACEPRRDGDGLMVSTHIGLFATTGSGTLVRVRRTDVLDGDGRVVRSWREVLHGVDAFPVHEAAALGGLLSAAALQLR